MSTLRQCLGQVSDPRRAQGKRYDLEHVLLYCVLAVVSGATSYRKIHIFIDTHWPRLNEVFGSRWKRAPAYTAVRKILQGLDAAQLEAAMRSLADEQAQRSTQTPARSLVAIDGKTLRGSLDRLEDRQAAQVLSALAVNERVVLGHVLIEDGATKDCELAAAQRLIEQLGLAGVVYTLDALHLQKNAGAGPGQRGAVAGAAQGQPAPAVARHARSSPAAPAR